MTCQILNLILVQTNLNADCNAGKTQHLWISLIGDV